MLHLSQNLTSKCAKSHIFLDTDLFICAAKHTELLDLLAALSKESAAYVTTTSVVFEYTRGSRSLEELRLRREFVNGIVQRIMTVGNFFENAKNDAFSVVMSLILKPGNSQYTDFLLAVALYQYRNLVGGAYVLSADAKAFPMTLFDIEGIVTIDNERGEIAHLYLISLNKEKYTSIAAGI